MNWRNSCRATSKRNPRKRKAGRKPECVRHHCPGAEGTCFAELRQLILEPWPAIRDSVAVNESKMFAQGLEGLGRTLAMPNRWSTTRKNLLRDAENYAVTDLEKHLGEFSALVEQLDRGATIMTATKQPVAQVKCETAPAPEVLAARCSQ